MFINLMPLKFRRKFYDSRSYNVFKNIRKKEKKSFRIQQFLEKFNISKFFFKFLFNPKTLKFVIYDFYLKLFQ
jgi:hypothetical protein